MYKCLVTGHKGYIGSNLFKSLKDKGYEVLGIDIKDGNNVIECLKDAGDKVFWDFKPDYIFHLACEPRVGYSVEEPVKTMHNNVLATTAVLNYARKVGTKRVIYSDSSAVVGNGDFPTNPYGLQKLISEMECRLYSELYGLDTVCLRYFNVYSECQKADGPYTTAIANWMEFLRRGERPFITGDGTQRRDMVHLHDIVSANIFGMTYEKPFAGKWFDVGTGKNISLNEMAIIVYNHFPGAEFKYTTARAGEVQQTVADTQPLSDLGWVSTVEFERGIGNCFLNLRAELKKIKGETK